jgi:hypothetical protein
MGFREARTAVIRSLLAVGDVTAGEVIAVLAVFISVHR